MQVAGGITGLLIVLALATPAHAGVAGDAEAVLERHCARCHGGGTKASKGGFDYLFVRERLVANRMVVPGKPGESRLLERVIDGEMPPKSVLARPSRKDIATLRRWIVAGAPARHRTPHPVLLGLAGIDERVRADLLTLPAPDRRHARYFSFVHLRDGGADRARLDRAGAALGKLLNSLSWRPRLVATVAVGRERILFRVDLRALGWSHSTWERIAHESPFALVRSGPALAARRLTGTSTPVLRGDWFVATASRPPMYHQLLGLPTTLEVLGDKLGVDIAADQRGLRVMRAGFNGSGVSRHNRVIERHRSRYGYLWMSYDFAASRGQRSIFDHPLDFRPDGSEVIFSLPNGLQAYMIVNRSGRRIDRAPTSIVVDPKRPDRAVVNGVSCMGCHQRGIISKPDQLRAHVQRNANAFTRRDRSLVGTALAMYRPSSVLLGQMARDRKHFEKAARSLSAMVTPEPISEVSRRFDEPLTTRAAAAELGLTAGDLRRAIAGSSSLRLRLGPLVASGAMKRDAFAAAFVHAARVLRAGEVFRFLDRVRRAELRCGAGGRDACFEVGLAYGDGRGRRRAPRRARVFFDRACRRGHGKACRRIGLLHYRGRGVVRNRSLAGRFFVRGCKLGSALACSNAGFLYRHGRGVTVSHRRALRYFARACSRGRASSCTAAGEIAASGSGSVRRDQSRAAGLFARGCHLGDGLACHRLAIQYRWGRGVPIDWWRSLQKLRRACHLGHRRSCWLVATTPRGRRK
jgi:TPR repeat protein